MRLKNLLLTLLMLPLYLLAQTPQLGSLTQEDGLHSASVTSVLRDRYGFVFLGTEQGVSRFDGTNILNIDFPKGDTQRNLAVNTMAEQDGESLLLGNKVGLWQLDRRRLSIRRIHRDAIDVEVYDMVRTPDGTFFIATAQGLFKLRGDRIAPVNLFAHRQVANHSVRRLALSGHRLFLLTGPWLAEAPVGRPDAVTFHRLPTALADAHLTSLASARGVVYIGTRGQGVLAFNPRTHRFSTFAGDIRDVSGLSTDGKGHLLVATSFDGCMELSLDSRQVIHRYTSQPAPMSPDVCRTRISNAVVFCRDNEGNSWIGYNFFGLDYSFLNRGIFHTFALPGLFDSADHAVRSFLLDGQRTLLGTRNGLYVVDKTRPSVTSIGRAILGTDIVACIRRVGSTYLVGTIGGGLHRLNATSLAPMPSPQLSQLAGANIYDMVSDQRGGLWVCSSAGLGHYDAATGALHLYTTRNSQLPDNEVFCMGLSRDGRGWVSTAGGLCMWNPDQRMVTTAGMLPQVVRLGLLRSVKTLADGRLLFIPQNGNPAVLNPSSGSLRPLSFESLGAGQVFLDIQPFGHRRYIVTCSNAVYLVGPSGSVRRFGHIDGLANSQFQSHAIWIDPSTATYWAATNGGLVFARLSNIGQAHFRHIPITLSEIQTDHWFTPQEVSAVALDSLLTLSRHNNEFTARFTPLAFGNTRDLAFRYRLEGHDKAWRLAERSRTIAYHDLWPGRYTLRIEAVGMPEMSGSLVVDVPLTSTALLIIAVMLLLAALAGHVLWCHHYRKPYFWKRFAPQPAKYQKSRLDEKEGRRLQQALLRYMEENRPYLNPDLQMADLAKALGCSPHTLSQLFSLQLHRNYYDFIAEYRIKAFQQLAQQPANRNLTITALAEQCGFKSRNPFLVAFKKATGMTPKDYMKRLKE